MVIFMFSHHSIKNENNEEVLYLYIDYDFEFASLGNDVKNKKQNIYNQIKKYLKERKVKFKGHIIYLVLNGVIMGTILFNYPMVPKKETKDFNYINELPLVLIKEDFIDNKNNIEDKVVEEIIPKQEIVEKKEVVVAPKEIPKPNQKINKEINEKVSNEPILPPNDTFNQIMVTLHRSNGKTENIELEEYIIGVVGAEMPASFHTEALKAQAVVARTYTLKMVKENKNLTDTTKHQVYKDINQLKTLWGSDFEKYYNKVKSAVMETKGQYITYNNDYIDAVYHSTNNGKTESAKEVFGYHHPYLVSVDSHWDKQATSYLRETSKDLNFVNNLLGINLNDESRIEVTSKTEGDNIDKINIDGKDFTGISIRELFGLRSADFDIVVNGDQVIFITRGYGHGVGMSQYGANGMAKEGYQYKEIISHYYPNTVLKKI